MTKKIKIWGRTFNLKVIFDVYDNEDILSMQKEALEIFVAKSDTLFSSYKDVEKYCLKLDGDSIDKPVENIFKYVIPTALYVKRNEKNRVVILLCNYRYDEEHGIALIYENEVLKQIGTQQII